MFQTIVMCCIVAHVGKVRVLPSGCFYFVYLVLMNDLWFGRWIRMSSRVLCGKARANTAINFCGR